MENEKTKSIYDEFIGKYELSKTLRFELKPTEATGKLLKQNKVFEKDKTIDDSYNQAKFYFDEMHREFINNSLSGLPTAIIDPLIKGFVLKEAQEKEGNKKESGKEWEKTRKAFCSEIAEIFAANDREIAQKYEKNEKDESSKPLDGRTRVKFLLSAKSLAYVKNKFPEEKEKEFTNKKWPSLYVNDLENSGNKKYIFSSFEKFSTYLGKFQETRNNLYTADDKATSVASRIIDNFVVFQGNRGKFENKLKSILSETSFFDTEKEIFEQNLYVDCFVQAGIDKYNAIIGTLNKQIKELRDKGQQEAKIAKKEFKKSNYPLLVEMDKQILSYKDKEKELIENDQDLRHVFEDFAKNNEIKLKQDLFIWKFFNGDFEDEYGKIYLHKKVLNTISRKWFVDANAFELLLPQTAKKEDKSIANVKTHISLADIKLALEKEENSGGLSGDIYKDKYYDDENGLRIRRSANESERFGQFLSVWKFEFDNLFKNKQISGGDFAFGYEACLNDAKNVRWEYLESKNKNGDDYKNEVGKIKRYADSSLAIYQMLKYFVLSGNNAPLGSDLFYGEFNQFYQGFEFIRYYNGLRNYITKKAFNADKIKLNFNNGQLLSGFDKNKEKEKFGIILRKDGVYYLGILVEKYKNIFENIKDDNSAGCYEKMEYKLFPDPKRMIPKIAFADKNKEVFGLTEEIINIKKEYEDFQKQKQDKDHWKDEFDKDKCVKLIGYYQKCLEIGGYKKEFCLSWKKPNQYIGIGDFNDDIYRQNYKVSFKKINGKYIDEKVDKGELYLFRINNKDFSEKSTGSKNIHTLYFLNLFAANNLGNPVLQLAGNAEIFYRLASLDKSRQEKEMIITKINAINNKKSNPYHLRRYSEDKLFFHIPIKINSGKKEKDINRQVVKFLAGNSNVNIIGIDRGEKNLLYYSVINQKGEILSQGSLNTINNINYFDKLVAREKGRQADRESWNQIEQIKDLKKGYLSGVIHKICELIREFDAIVVLEDLNMRFKQIRGGIERSVYQQFEKMLIDKLGYMIFKDKNIDEIGGIAKGYQLAAPFESFEKIYRQTGILFYTQADYTSVTDPLTGFRKNIYIGNSWSMGKIWGAIDKFKSIKWDGSIGGYVFTYNQADFVFEANGKKEKNKKNIKPQEIVSKEWAVCSKVARIERFKNGAGYWDCKPINLNEKFKELFDVWGIDSEGDILRQIREKEGAGELRKNKFVGGEERDFYHRFAYLFNLVLQLRNSFSQKIAKDKNGKDILVGEDIDFIASPVYPFFSMEAKNEKTGQKISNLNVAGFDKRIIAKNRDEIIRSLNGDANGAYNIARKGIIILEKIKENTEKPNLFISKNEWDKFAQGQYKEK